MAGKVRRIVRDWRIGMIRRDRRIRRVRRIRTTGRDGLRVFGDSEQESWRTGREVVAS